MVMWDQVLQHNKGEVISGNLTKPLRIEFVEAVYHIISKGNTMQAAFLDEKDFADFLGVLSSAVKKNIVPVSWQY